MEEGKSGKTNVVLICIIVAIIAVVGTLFATGTISFNKDSNTNNNSGEKDNNKASDNDKNNTNDNNDYTGKYDYWMNYLLAKDDLKVSIERERYADDYVTNTIDKTVELTKEQVEGLFVKLMGLKLVNRCQPGRGTGDPNYDDITFSYSVNGVKYELSLSGMDYILFFYDDDNADKSLLDAIEKSKDLQDGEASEYNSCAYEYDGFKSTLLDEYFK